MNTDRMHNHLMRLLLSGPDHLWQQVLQTHVRNSVADHAFSEVDWEAGSVRDRWRELDQPRIRRRLFVGQPTWQSLAGAILSQTGLRDAFNGVLRANHLRQINSTQFRAAVNAVAPALVHGPVSQGIITENPFPAVWGLLGNLLASEVHRRTHPAFPDREWSLLQGLLLAGFFATCRLPFASQVADLFDEHQSVFLSVRGVFLRIPEAIGPAGILDRPVPISARPRGPVHLAMAAISPLVAATEQEANLTPNGQGLLHRLIPVDDPRYRPSHHLSDQLARRLRNGRDVSYRLYEHTIVTFLALSAIECLLRTWAHHRNSNHASQIPIFKANGQPNGVLEWVNDLGCSADVLDSVRELYDPSRTNIRNRVLHGNLLEIHSKRLESHLPVIDSGTFGWLNQLEDSYHPENIAMHCLDCLERIDVDMRGLGVTAADAAWAGSVMLTVDEIDFGHRVYCDFFGPDAVRWAQTVSDYLVVVMPDLKQLFTVGFIEWMRGKYQVNPVSSMLMGFVYEAMHRLTAHLLQADVAGIQGGSVQKGHQQRGLVSHFQYRMLDTRRDGLFSDQVLDRILEHIQVSERVMARQIFDLAMKARNALAHGALIQSDQHTLDGLGHIFAKAAQTLVTAGLDHLTRQAAFFIYRNEHPNVHGQSIEDWTRAEREIFDRISRVAKESRFDI